MMGTHAAMQSIVVYLIERHPLDLPAEGPNFQWLHFNNNYKRQLKEWIGPHDPEAISFLIERLNALSHTSLHYPMHNDIY
jgi:hypothetical protein